MKQKFQKIRKCPACESKNSGHGFNESDAETERGNISTLLLVVEVGYNPIEVVL